MKKLTALLTLGSLSLFMHQANASTAPITGGRGGPTSTTVVGIVPDPGGGDPGGGNPGGGGPGGGSNPGGNPPGGSPGINSGNSISVGDSKDMKDMKSMVSYPMDDGFFDVFVVGTGGYDDVGKASDPSHFYSLRSGGHIGAEYHFPTDWSVGLSLGYQHTDSNFGNASASSTQDSYGPTLFASYSHEGWFADGSASGAYNTYTTDAARPVPAPPLGATADAHGATEGWEYGGHLDGGYLFHNGDWSYGPLGGLTYKENSIRGFSEDGAGVNDLSFTNSNTASLRSYLGGVVRYQAQICSVTVLPYLSLGWQHEFLDTNATVNGQQIASGTGFTASSPVLDRDSADIHLGANANITDKVTVFVDYGNQVNATFVNQTLNGGVSVAF